MEGLDISVSKKVCNKTVSNNKKSFSYEEEVKESKNGALKERLRTLILERKMSESEFYNSLGISKQHWYYISWGLWYVPNHLKFKIANALGVDTIVIWRETNE